jgi:capsid protein
MSSSPTFADRAAAGIDAVIRVVAPGWANRRLVARAQAQALSQFVGGGFGPLQTDRLTGAVTGRQGTLDERLPWWDRLKMIGEFDKLVHENPLLCGLTDQYVVNVIPAEGVRPIPQTGNDDLNGELTKRFEDWAETAEVRGLSFWDYQRPWLKTMLGHGDNLTVQVNGRLQGVSANRIQTPMKHGRYEGDRVHQGIYTGTGPTPKGYYVGTRRGSWVHTEMKFRYIPAALAHYGFDPGTFDLDCYRGCSRFLSSFPYIKRVESLLRFKTFQEKMAAVFGIAITKDKEKTTSPVSKLGTGRPAETVGEAKTTATRPDIELFSGMGITLNQDEDIKTIEHKANAGDFESFVRLVCRILALGANLPLEFCLLDWSQANYYGNKMAAGSGKRQFLETFIRVRRLVSWVYRWKVEEFIRTGLVKLPAGYQGDYLAHETTLPPPIEVDDLKAFQLHRQKVEAGVDTWDAWCRGQNRVFAKITEQRKTELEMQKNAGLPIVATSTPGVKLLSELEQES